MFEKQEKSQGIWHLNDADSPRWVSAAQHMRNLKIFAKFLQPPVIVIMPLTLWLTKIIIYPICATSAEQQHISRYDKVDHVIIRLMIIIFLQETSINLGIR